MNIKDLIDRLCKMNKSGFATGLFLGFALTQQGPLAVFSVEFIVKCAV